ncbi:ABC transporter substrate-binding protein [Halomicrobium sp. LC1Hm]|uniref:ABC transporter substrate-binding protein n=1 Tax=Halomicrobium sp. LC1Hm TaxID=2610902 RepID=UPI0012983953|nr:ABC transporter substrate-binding protein [Halomicrobium sp. LC1Hm]QGA84350.1 ABC-type Fe3+-hydroxamate transport system, periplasmic component [Halomicrobium sp. LC1Hm]
MRGDSSGQEPPTRREYMKYGGAVIGGGLLAGCTGDSGSGGDGESTDARATTPEATAAATETDADTSYSVTMEPMGTVEFDAPPERWVSYLSTYGDMGIALGKADSLQGLWDPDGMPDVFYDALPGVDISFEDVSPISGDGEFDKEIFYELDADVHLLDPNWIGVLADDWDEDDAEEIATGVDPFLGNYIRRRGDDWHDYPYYSLYEAFEIVADAFDERERYEALASVHDDVQATIEERLPPAAERPTVGLVSVNSQFENATFYVYPVQAGNNHKQYRDLGMRGAFDDHIEGGYGQFDYEQLLDVDPDAIVFQYGFSHVSTEEFESRMETMRADPVGSQLSAVQNDRLYRGGTAYQGPIVNLFQTEAAARQFYPEAFGEWNGIETLREESLTLFDRQRVADVISGDF